MIKQGLTNISNVKLGNTQIAKVTLGNNVIWENWVKRTGSFLVGTSSWSDGNDEHTIGVFSYQGKPIILTKCTIVAEKNAVGTFAGKPYIKANGVNLVQVDTGDYYWQGELDITTEITFNMGEFAGDGRGRRATVYVTEFYSKG